jgi:hypothetical protein
MKKRELTEGAQNWPFLILIIFPVLAAATRRSVCYKIQKISELKLKKTVRGKGT